VEALGEQPWDEPIEKRPASRARDAGAYRFAEERDDPGRAVRDPKVVPTARIFLALPWREKIDRVMPRKALGARFCEQGEPLDDPLEQLARPRPGESLERVDAEADPTADEIVFAKLLDGALEPAKRPRIEVVERIGVVLEHAREVLDGKAQARWPGVKARTAREVRERRVRFFEVSGGDLVVSAVRHYGVEVPEEDGKPRVSAGDGRPDVGVLGAAYGVADLSRESERACACVAFEERLPMGRGLERRAHEERAARES
jgi:hypothetical protein